MFGVFSATASTRVTCPGFMTMIVGRPLGTVIDYFSDKRIVTIGNVQLTNRTNTDTVANRDSTVAEV